MVVLIYCFKDIIVWRLSGYPCTTFPLGGKTKFLKFVYNSRGSSSLSLPQPAGTAGYRPKIVLLQAVAVRSRGPLLEENVMGRLFVCPPSILAGPLELWSWADNLQFQ